MRSRHRERPAGFTALPRPAALLGLPVLLRLLGLLGLLGLLALPGGCGGRSAVIQGELAHEQPEELRVWVVGRGGSEPVIDGGFELRRVAPGSADLRFVDGTDEVGRIRLDRLRGGARLSLQGLAFEADGLGFPARIALSRGRVVEINGIRMAAPGTLTGRVEQEAEVLAISSTADALLLRPRSERLPDLRVVIDAGTLAATPDGDPAPLDALRPGDTLRVEGRVVEGYVLATSLVVPRATVLRTAPGSVPDRRGAEGAPAGASRPAPGPPAGEEGRGRGRGRGRGGRP